MRNFSKLLQRGNFTPKERVLLMMANSVSKRKEGNGFLTEADITALSEGWTPKNNNEVDEFNRYNNSWRLIGYAEMDAQGIYLKARIQFLTLGILLRDFEIYPFYREIRQALDELAKIKRVSAKEAVEIVSRQRQEKLKEGYEFTQAIYELTFELIGKEYQKKLLKIDEDIETERNYLEEEQELAELYQAKDFETIAERVSKNFYNPHSKEYMSFATYACIPLWEVARRYVKENKLPYKEHTEKEDTKLIEARKPTSRDLLVSTLVEHARKKKETVEEIIKTACLKWIKEGLLEKEHKPLAVCQPEFLTKWIKTKEKAEEVLQELIDQGELSTRGKGKELTLTGDSLFNTGADYKFIRGFKERLDFYEPDLGIVKGKGEDYFDRELLIADKKFLSKSAIHLEIARQFFNRLSEVKETEENGKICLDLKKGARDTKGVFLKIRNNFVEAYESLLTFEDLFEKLSKFYGMDLTHKISWFVAECKEDIELFNSTLLKALKGEGLPFSEHYKEDKTKTHIDKRLLINVKKIDIWKIKPDNEIVELYNKELANTLGEKFE
ncbi:hypothetical protein ES705_21002 [subsurface metagenome]